MTCPTESSRAAICLKIQNYPKFKCKFVKNECSSSRLLRTLVLDYCFSIFYTIKYDSIKIYDLHLLKIFYHKKDAVKKILGNCLTVIMYLDEHIDFDSYQIPAFNSQVQSFYMIVQKKSVDPRQRNSHTKDLYKIRSYINFSDKDNMSHSVESHVLKILEINDIYTMRVLIRCIMSLIINSTVIYKQKRQIKKAILMTRETYINRILELTKYKPNSKALDNFQHGIFYFFAKRISFK